MKSKLKKRASLLIVLGIFFTISSIYYSNPYLKATSKDKSTDYRDYFTLDRENLKISAVSGKIHIDNNWAAAKAAGICTGDGTYSDPYIIEDFEIDGGGSGSCILIENSNVYFKIENCTVYNSGSEINDAGIELGSVSNGFLINNDASNHDNFGIYLAGSNNNTVTGNIATNNDNGIVLGNSHNNTLSGNIATGNTFWYGIELAYCRNNTVLGNNATNNLNGIVLFYSLNNTISGNIVNSNTNIGIYLHDSHYNTVTLNMMENNGFNDLGGGSGLYIGAGGDTSHGNSIYLNCFINNHENAFDDGVNYWDNGIKGNYWSNYNGSDPDGNGIGNIPYIISGSAGSQDNFPLTKCPISGGGIPIELIVLISVISGGVVIGVATLLLIRRKRKIIE